MFHFLKKKKTFHSQYMNREPDYVYPAENEEQSGNRAYFWVQGPLLVSEVFGNVDMSMAEELIRISERILKDQPYMIARHNWAGIENVPSPVQQFLTEWSFQRKMEGKIKSIVIYAKISIKMQASSFKHYLVSRGENNRDVTEITRTMDDFNQQLNQTITELSA